MFLPGFFIIISSRSSLADEGVNIYVCRERERERKRESTSLLFAQPVCVCAAPCRAIDQGVRVKICKTAPRTSIDAASDFYGKDCARLPPFAAPPGRLFYERRVTHAVDHFALNKDIFGASPQATIKVVESPCHH
jgi:hypothetical protein